MDKETLEQIIGILKSCSWQKIAIFNYKNSKGIKSNKRVEVYDLTKEGKFWGYDLEVNQLKQFLFVNVCDFIEIGEDFNPRYEKK